MSIAITFDTLKFANKLKAAGVSEKQAEVISEVQRETLENAVELAGVYKSDVHRVEKKVDHLEKRFDSLDKKVDRLDHKLEVSTTQLKAEMNLLKWMVGLVIGGVIAIILKSFFVNLS